MKLTGAPVVLFTSTARVAAKGRLVIWNDFVPLGKSAKFVVCTVEFPASR